MRFRGQQEGERWRHPLCDRLKAAGHHRISPCPHPCRRPCPLGLSLPRPSALPRRPSRLLSVLPSCRSARLVHSARWLPPAALPAAESLEPAARATGGRLLGGLVAAAAATSRPDVATAPLDAALLTIRARWLLFCVRFVGDLVSWQTPGLCRRTRRTWRDPRPSAAPP